MKIITYFLLLVESIYSKTNYISTTNKLKLEADTYFQAQEYPKALSKYYELVNKYHLKEEELMFNLSTCYFILGNVEISKKIYAELCKSSNKNLQSKSFQQMGVIAALMGNKNQALIFFRKSLIADAQNYDSKYNYELLLYKMPDKSKSESKQKTKVSKNQDGRQAEMESKDDSDLEEEWQSAKSNKVNSEQDVQSKIDANTKLEAYNVQLSRTESEKTIRMIELLKNQEKDILIKYHLTQTYNDKRKSLKDW